MDCSCKGGVSCCKHIVAILLYCNRSVVNWTKIGEGLYGEVFSSSVRDQTRLMKIIPVEGDILVNDEPQKLFQEIITEIVILQELDNLGNSEYNNTPCFTKVQKIRCARGKYSKEMIQAWEDYNAQHTSENDHPRIFGSHQQFLVIEMDYGGRELEDYAFHNAKSAFYAFLQLAYSLAIAEDEMEFEHRDLHLGNVLIQETNEVDLVVRLRGKMITLKTDGVRVTIIDNTLSRCRYGRVVIFNDLEKDPTLFESEGSEQFDVYRKMREATKKDWRSFTPVTNLLWLQYILLELTKRTKYKAQSTKEHRSYIEKLRHLHSSILNYGSTFQLVTQFLSDS